MAGTARENASLRHASAAWRPRARTGRALRCALFLLGGAVAAGGAEAAGPEPAEAVRGVPFTRSYSHEDIGNVPRGSRLGFDRFGRVAVIHDAVYSVLNDSVWLNLAEPGGVGRVSMTNVVQAADGRGYYGARGAWGRVEPGADGKLHAVSLVPPDPPGWIATAVFSELVATDDGVYFASWNGVVFWDLARRRSLAFEVPKAGRMFRVGASVHLSTIEGGLYRIDPAGGELVPVPGTQLEGSVVDRAAPLDERRTLLALRDGGLAVFDGRELTPWPRRDAEIVRGDVAAMRQLVDGRVAIGVTGRGLFLFSTEGELLMALTTPEYRNVTELANREPGVLWAETEDAVEKILYGSPLSAFGQRVGLPVRWPLVARWNGRIVVASDGKLYGAVAGARGEPTRFAPMSAQPTGGAWALAARGERLLAGNGSGVYSLEDDGAFHPLHPMLDVVHLVMTAEDRCFVVGRTEIALLEREHGDWVERVPRIPGVPNPAVVHRVGDSVWMEMGGDGVARLWEEGGQLRLDVVPNEAGTEDSWVNVGSVGELVVLSAARETPRRFFDQRLGRWVEARALRELLDRSPHWIARLQRDESGVIWATHNEGLVRFTPDGDGYEIDANSFDRVDDRYPVVRILPGDDVWLSAQRSLYHLERDWVSEAPPPPRPVLVSVMEPPNGEELTPGVAVGPAAREPVPRLPHARNNLSFRFYSGTDAWRRAPAYEYRLGGGEPWTPVDGSVVAFRGLREGRYELQVRLAGAEADARVSEPFAFEIAPPWHRSSPAYLVFGLGAAVALVAASRGSSYLERRRNRRLERVVRERTRQLEDAMAKLGEETRNAATLAERDRLAKEIHDSVQQGLTGAILQLDSTLKTPAVGEELRARLNVVRNMVAYSRQEVEHAVWDMESPLLEGIELADALRNLTAFIGSGETAVAVSVEGEPVALERAVNHNLLRIAQEATTNALRHARARTVRIRLAYAAGWVSLEVADDGQGFRPAEVMRSQGGHLGLRGMKSRARKVNGTLEILGAPGEGTRIRVTVRLSDGQNPLGQNAEAKHPD